MLSSHKRAFMLRGECLLKMGRLAEALRDTTAAINLGHRDGHRARGQVYLEQGNLKEALEDLSLAVRIEPSDRRAWALRARVHQKMGNEQRWGAGGGASSTLA